MKNTRKRVIVFFFALSAVMLSLTGCTADGLIGPEADTVIMSADGGNGGGSSNGGNGGSAPANDPPIPPDGN